MSLAWRAASADRCGAQFGGKNITIGTATCLLKAFDTDHSGSITFWEYVAAHKFIMSLQVRRRAVARSVGVKTIRAQMGFMAGAHKVARNAHPHTHTHTHARARRDATNHAMNCARPTHVRWCVCASNARRAHLVQFLRRDALQVHAEPAGGRLRLLQLSAGARARARTL